MEQKHRLEIVGITYNQIESGVYALVLKEADGSRRIPIIIGFPEAQAIECRLQNINTPRPLTHDMTTGIMNAYGITLKEVLIHQLPNGVFAADLYLTDGVTDLTIDARSSDAVALAIRNDAPIYCTDEVMQNASFNQDEKENIGKAKAESQRLDNPVNQQPRDPSPSELKSLTVEELTNMMEKAVNDENYEEAARIKAELDRRK